MLREEPRELCLAAGDERDVVAPMRERPKDRLIGRGVTSVEREGKMNAFRELRFADRSVAQLKAIVAPYFGDVSNPLNELRASLYGDQPTAISRSDPEIIEREGERRSPSSRVDEDRLLMALEAVAERGLNETKKMVNLLKPLSIVALAFLSFKKCALVDVADDDRSRLGRPLVPRRR